MQGALPRKAHPIPKGMSTGSLDNPNREEISMLKQIIAIAAIAAGGVLLAKQLKKARMSGGRATIEESINVNVPVSTAYNQWTQFTDFPNFMDSVQEVRQIDNTHLHWRARIAGKDEEWDAEITEQVPDERIAWRSTGGVNNAGVVTFNKLSDGSTRIKLRMDYTPQGIDEQIGDALGLVRMQTRGNLQRFKQMLESRGKETGAWRGSVAPH
jgi:uncharacterized membrane protein